MTERYMLRPLILGLAALLLGACRSNPAIPFRDDHWQFFALGGYGALKDDFVEHRSHVGFEVVVPEEGTHGWQNEVGMRFAWGDGRGVRNLDHAGTSQTISERELDFREVYWGARQVFHEGETLEPFFSVGLAAFRFDSHETFVDAGSVERHDGDHGNEYGVYMRTGILWNSLRDVLADDTEVKLGVDMRGLYASEYSALEFALLIGLGR